VIRLIQICNAAIAFERPAETANRSETAH
jgi:hypothetical protein